MLVDSGAFWPVRASKTTTPHDYEFQQLQVGQPRGTRQSG